MFLFINILIFSSTQKIKRCATILFHATFLLFSSFAIPVINVSLPVPVSMVLIDNIIVTQ